VNAPAAICAMYLYYATGDATYKTKAKQIMDWTKSRLYNASTGEVKGAINSAGTITEGSRTYTQGTFIGAAGELQNYYPADNWKAAGQKAMDYTKNTMSSGAGLLPDEYCGVDDCPGFKSILARWACKFVANFGLASTYGSWLNYNARQAWTYRNSSGLMWAQWWRRTPDAFLTSWETTSGISMMNNVFLYNSGSTAGRELMDEADEHSPVIIDVYPVPVQNTLMLKREGVNIVSVRIINVNGKTVLDRKITEQELDVTDLPSGTYTIIIADKIGEIRKRFIKTN
jgi:hypothetical protein